MSELKLTADSGGGSVSFKGPASTTSNAAVQLTLPQNDGDASQFLQTNGSGALTWAAAGGGKLLKLAYDSDSAQVDISSTTAWTDTGLSISYTPTSASSTLKIYANINLWADGGASNHGQVGAKFVKDSSDIGEELVAATGYGGTEAVINGIFPLIHFESASNTNARTYKVQVRNKEGTASNAQYNLYSGVSHLIIEEYDLS